MIIAPMPDLSAAVDNAAAGQIHQARYTGPIVRGPGTTVVPGPVRPWTPPRPGQPPPPRPTNPNVVRPNYADIPYNQQTFGERMQNAFDAQRRLERQSEVRVESAGEENSVAGPTYYEIVRKRRSRRNCCRADLFLNEWLTAGHSIENQMDHGITFSRQDYANFPRGRMFSLRGYTYQYFVTQDYLEYTCSGGGETSRADGQEAARCWLIEAKYHFSARSYLRSQGLDPNLADRPLSMEDRFSFPGVQSTPPSSSGPSVSALPQPPPPPGESEQFRKYGAVINDPDAPAEDCWNIGLRVVASQRFSLWGYKNSMLRYNIPGRVEWRAAPGPED